MNNLPPNISENDREFQDTVDCPSCDSDGCYFCDDEGHVFEDQVEEIARLSREEDKADE